jgi:hypothetical protein
MLKLQWSSCLPALLLSFNSCSLNIPSGEDSSTASAYERCVREFSSATPGASVDEPTLWTDIEALLRAPEGREYLKRLDEEFPSVVYSETVGVVYFLVFDLAWKTTSVTCLGNVDRSEFVHAKCGNDPLYDLGRFQCDRLSDEGDMLGIHFIAPTVPSYCRTYGLEPGARYVARLRMELQPVWPVPVIRE